MSSPGLPPFGKTPGLLYKPHPWHGVPLGDEAPEEVTVYVEIVPTDTVKYEVDKRTGYLMVDRPQRFSNVCPSLYGLIPQTCLLYTSPSPRDRTRSRMPSSA